MKRQILTLLALCAAAFSLHAQTDWKAVERLMAEGSYKTAYGKAESVYMGSRQGRERLLAAYYMAQAAANYQEDARDSAEARYRRLLSDLTGVEKALCHAFLGEYKEALAEEVLLRATPVEKIKAFCESGGTMNMTPTAADVIVRMMIERGELTPQERAVWQRKLVDWHRGDSEDLRIWHDLKLLELMAQVPNRPLKLDTLLQYIEKYRTAESPLRTMLYVNVANRLNREGEYERAVNYCDTAIALAPKSEGAIECANLRGEIQRVRIEVAREGLTFAPSAKSLQRVRYRNVEHLWFRIIPYIEGFEYGEKTKARLVAAKPMKEWNLTVGRPGKKYDYVESYFAVPEMKAGRYLLLVSPTENFKTEGFMAYEMNCTDMLLMQDIAQGLLIDRKTGRPIVGQTIRVEERRYNEKPNVLETVTTDRDGRYRITTKSDSWRTYIVAERDGYRLETQYRRRGNTPPVKQLRCEVRTDRPIYKPGDTIKVALFAYRCDGLDAEAVTAIGLNVKMIDPNGQQVAQDSVFTDDFGIASMSFVVPKDRIAGIYQLSVKYKNEYVESTTIHVEEYKQPKFMVTMSSNTGEVPMFGKEMIVKGMAVSYSGVPVSDAKVKYTVRRSQMHRWWWRGYGPVDQTEVGSGEVVTAADGSFELAFVPEPDSSVELSAKPSFEYTVEVDVTDINGESHPARTSMRVGFRNAYISLDGAEDVRTLDSLKPRYFDLNGNPLDGKVDIKIERLLQPATPLLDPPAMVKGAHHTMSYEDFRKAFPLYAYSEDWNNRDNWLAVAEDGKQKDASGVYRITLTAPDADTVVEYRRVTTVDATKVQSQELLWTDVEKSTVEVGEMASFRFGSRFNDVDIYYMLRVGNEERDFRHLTISDELQDINIPVDSAMLGGFCVDVIAVKENIIEHKVLHFAVPFTHKKLEMEISTFRDKLQPGESEEWTIKVKSGERRVESAMVMTMYDDALNSYGYSSGWGFSPWRSNSLNVFQQVGIYNGVGWWLRDYPHRYYNGSRPSVWTLKEGLPYGHHYWGRRMYKTAAARNVAVVELAVVEDVEYEEESFAVDAAVPMAAGSSKENENGEQELDPQIRTNLNTLAFFVSDLRTDSSGTATYGFSVPELLARWNVRGLAVTRDVRIGTLDRTLVTQKRLMVQPNMPRFLRSGDSLSLMAKVVLSEQRPEVEDVAVTFLLTDAATGDTICNHLEHIKVKDAAQVRFDVEVPQDVYVATYRIVATAPGMSDGEQGQVPVVGNRQAVTVSQAMYINGVGEKHYRLPEFLASDESRVPNLVTAEVVSNPIWLAVKVMPFLKDMENPSTLYLANQLFVNSKGQKIISEIGPIAAVGDGVSRLTMNEEVKQTLLQTTPWVRDAVSEEEQMAAVANYFDAERLQAELSKLSSRLVSLQNGDGGWSWMPEGKSSVWVTQQVLQRVAAIQSFDKRSVKQSLAYVDREEQRYYEQYIKPYLKKQPDCGMTDIDYLFMRSLYGKASTEAYKYYYNNALMRYKHFENLYTQAQLALIFQRHGDRKQARDLIRRLKEKSLVSDEMGMYWRDNRSSWWWYQRPIETQALLIQAFLEVTPDDTLSIGQMQQWLLKQKQTTHWGNDAATTRAIEALLCGGRKVERGDQMVDLALFGESLTPRSLTSPEGYMSQRWTADSLNALRSNNSDEIVIRKSTPGIAWGAVYYQFTDDMDKIPASESGMTLKRSYSKEGSGALTVGDRVKVRIEISCDRTMEYLELIDGRPSCVEPLSTRAGWRYSDGLSYYVTVNNTDTRCYIDRLEKGRYVMEYEVYVTNPGTFLSGPATLQCMYAPEFRAVSPAQYLRVR